MATYDWRNDSYEDGVPCVVCGFRHAGVGPDDMPTSYCESCYQCEICHARPGIDVDREVGHHEECPKLRRAP